MMGEWSKVERTYTVSWTMEYDAFTYEDAAKQAWGTLQDPENIATILFVQTYGEQGRNFDMETDEPKELRQ